MMHTVWSAPERYDAYWSQFRGRHVAGGVAVMDVGGSLLRHPAVAESAVVGLPDALKGERIKADVVVRPVAQPAEIELVASLPMTRSGSIVAGCRGRRPFARTSGI